MVAPKLPDGLERFGDTDLDFLEIDDDGDTTEEAKPNHSSESAIKGKTSTDIMDDESTTTYDAYLGDDEPMADDQEGVIVDVPEDVLREADEAIEQEGERYVSQLSKRVERFERGDWFAADQPRRPAGSPEGGQFAPKGEGGGSAVHKVGDKAFGGKLVVSKISVGKGKNDYQSVELDNPEFKPDKAATDSYWHDTSVDSLKSIMEGGIDVGGEGVVWSTRTSPLKVARGDERVSALIKFRDDPRKVEKDQRGMMHGRITTNNIEKVILTGGKKWSYKDGNPKFEGFEPIVFASGDQPRHPSGSPQGGQFAPKGGGSISADLGPGSEGMAGGGAASSTAKATSAAKDGKWTTNERTPQQEAEQIGDVRRRVKALQEGKAAEIKLPMRSDIGETLIMKGDQTRGYEHFHAEAKDPGWLARTWVRGELSSPYERTGTGRPRRDIVHGNSKIVIEMDWNGTGKRVLVTAFDVVGPKKLTEEMEAPLTDLPATVLTPPSGVHVDRGFSDLATSESGTPNISEILDADKAASEGGLVSSHFDPAQPRHPAGSPQGGKFAPKSGGGPSGSMDKGSRIPPGDPIDKDPADVFAVSRQLRNAAVSYAENEQMSDAVHDYTNIGYRSINGALRSGDYDERVGSLDAAIGMQSTPVDVIAYRGLRHSQIADIARSDPQALVNAEVTDKAYISTSVNPGVAANFAEMDVDEMDVNPVIAVIKVPKGSKALFVSNGSNEKELILPRKSRFKIVGVRTDDVGSASNAILMEMELLPEGSADE